MFLWIVQKEKNIFEINCEFGEPFMRQWVYYIYGPLLLVYHKSNKVG